MKKNPQMPSARRILGMVVDGVLTFSRLKSIINNRSDLRLPVEPTAWVQKHGNLRGAEYYAQQGGISC